MRVLLKGRWWAVGVWRALGSLPLLACFLRLWCRHGSWWFGSGCTRLRILVITGCAQHKRLWPHFGGVWQGLRVGAGFCWGVGGGCSSNWL